MSSFLENVLASFDRLLYVLFGRLICCRVVLSAIDELDVLTKTRELREEGFSTSFDLMLEDVHDDASIEKVAVFYQKLVRQMNASDKGNIVIKPTALGLDASRCSLESARTRFAKFLFAVTMAVQTKNIGLEYSPTQVEVDVESTRTMEDAFDAITLLRRQLPFHKELLRIAIPMHVKELPRLLERFRLLDFPVRIVKGAGVYGEPSHKLVPESEILERYEQYFIECLKKKQRPFIASMRDEKLIRKLLTKAELLGYKKDEFEIEMLYGLWTGLGRKLLKEGCRVTLYIPITLPWCADASSGYVRRRVSMFRKLACTFATSIFMRNT